MMDDRGRPALRHRHLQRLEHQRRAQVRGDRPAHDPAAEHVEDDGQVEEACQGRHVGDISDPEAIRRIRFEAPLDPIRCRPGLGSPARRARAAAPAHPGDAQGAHHSRDALAADRDAGCGQLGVNPRRAIRSPAAGVNRLHAGRQVRIGSSAS